MPIIVLTILEKGQGVVRAACAKAFILIFFGTWFCPRLLSGIRFRRLKDVFKPATA